MHKENEGKILLVHMVLIIMTFIVFATTDVLIIPRVLGFIYLPVCIYLTAKSADPAFSQKTFFLSWAFFIHSLFFTLIEYTEAGNEYYVVILLGLIALNTVNLVRTSMALKTVVK
jgi:hypothetical protein